MRTDWQEPGGPTGPAMPQLALPPLTPVTKKLLILNGVVFAAWFLVFMANESLVMGHLTPLLGLTPSLWREWFPLVPIWQLGTYGFLHDAGGVWHILGNMLMLYFFGTMLESILGSRRLLVLYFGAQLAGALFYLVPGVFTGSGPALGASGAVFGLVVAAATLRPRQTVFLFFIPITMMVLAIGIVAIDVFGLLVSLKGNDGVAHLIHLGGAAFGFATVKLGWIWRDPVQVFEARRAIAAEERRVDDAREMDRLLEKIHREGMSSLTKRERTFLKRVSSKK